MQNLLDKIKLMLILYIMDISFNTPSNKSYSKYEGVERKKVKLMLMKFMIMLLNKAVSE